jgi:hypothetical protein
MFVAAACMFETSSTQSNALSLSIQLPDTLSKLPDTLSKLPDTLSKLPDTLSTKSLSTQSNALSLSIRLSGLLPSLAGLWVLAPILQGLVHSAPLVTPALVVVAVAPFVTI